MPRKHFFIQKPILHLRIAIIEIHDNKQLEVNQSFFMMLYIREMFDKIVERFELGVFKYVYETIYLNALLAFFICINFMFYAEV